MTPTASSAVSRQRVLGRAVAAERGAGVTAGAAAQESAPAMRHAVHSMAVKVRRRGGGGGGGGGGGPAKGGGERWRQALWAVGELWGVCRVARFLCFLGRAQA